ncbi:hypothetical protein AB0J55_16745 [Amycolatopsis sp. NPDC049688]|uniref:hypothetical protein n=1 Tax=Amycolatopsis sp. NPDC049688 TaxID=3154733 RepID=UPI003449A3C9
MPWWSELRERSTDPKAPKRPDVDLRPSIVRQYSAKTLACYRARLGHYQHWCRIRGYQHATDAITTSKLVEYVHDQINRWDDSPDAPDPAGYPRYRPDTIRQTVNALIYWAERSTGQPPDDRAEKEALRRFADDLNQTHPAAWRVTARRSPKVTGADHRRQELLLELVD